MKNLYSGYPDAAGSLYATNAAEHKYKVLIEQSLSAYFLTIPDGSILETNEAATKMFGYTPEEFKTVSRKDLIDHNDPGFLMALKRREKNGFARVEATGIKKNGDRFPVSIFSAFFTNALGQIRTSTIVNNLTDQKKIEKDLQQVLDSITDGFFTVDNNWTVKCWNSELERITNIPGEDITGKNFWDFYNSPNKKNIYSKYKKAIRNKTPVNFEEYYAAENIWLEITIYPSASGISIFFKNITETRRLRELERIEKEFLEKNARTNSKLEETLSYYLKAIEHIHTGMICSVLKLEDGKLYNWASPSLPENYCIAIKGAAIGAAAGSCGTAAFKKEKVIVTDIEHDTRWIGYKDYALKEGLRSCWSFPILNTKGQVLGTFAIYYKQIKSPSLQEEKTIERARNILAVILENKIAEAAMLLSNERYNLVVKATNDLVWDWDLQTGKIYRNSNGLKEVYGHTDNEKMSSLQLWADFLHPNDKERILERIQYFTHSKKETAFRFEYRFKKSDGTYAYINDRGYITRDENGMATRMIGAAEDITERKNTERLIEESEQRYKMFVQQSTEGIWRIELKEAIHISTPAEQMVDYFYNNAIVAECNDAFAQMYGFGKAVEIIGIPLKKLMPRDKQLNRAFLTKFITNGFKITEEISYETDKNGNEVIFINNVIGIIEKNYLKRSWGTQRNITEQVKVETALKESENLLRTIVQTDPECIQLLNEQGELLEINAAGLAMIEADRVEDVLGKKMTALILPAYHSAFKKLIKEVFKGAAVKLSFEIEGLKGTRCYTETHAVPLKNATGNIIAVLSVTRDVTETKKAEVLLQNSVESYRHLFNNNPSSIIIWDVTDLKITEVNDTAIALYGYEREEFLQLSILDIYTKAEQSVFAEIVNQAREDSLFKKTMRWYHVTKPGTRVVMEVSSHAITYNGTKAVMALGNNVTEKVQLENSLIEERKIRQKQITDAVITGQEKERVEIGQELHDNINQILATAKLYLECAQAQKSFRSRLIEESKMLTEKAMLEIRKLSNSLIPPALEEIGLQEAINDLVQNISSVNALSIKTGWSDFDENVLNKKLKLTIFRIVQEQLNNIIKHAHASHAKISITQKEEQIYLCIEDDGIGFDTSKKRNGVGLKNIISRSEVNNGKVSIQSKPGEGCIMTVCFTTFGF